jgi:hypothetical protein
MRNLTKVSTPKKVLFIGLSILVLGIILLAIGLQSPAFSQRFQCGYDLGMNNSSITQDQISEYCNNQIPETENIERLITLGFGAILLITGLIVTGTGGIWLIVRRKERTEASSLSSEVNVEMMINNNRGERESGEEQDYRFTSKKVLIYCIIVGLISAILSIFIDELGLLSMVAFVFASITVWYMFGERLHKWQEKRRRSE